MQGVNALTGAHFDHCALHLPALHWLLLPLLPLLIAAADCLPALPQQLELLACVSHLVLSSTPNAGVVDYTSYTPGRPDPALFDTPPPCEGVAPTVAKGRTASQLRLLSLVPAVRYSGDAQVRMEGQRVGGWPCAAWGMLGC